MARKLSGIRRGITLIELLVVMMIMLILATIVVAFAPSFQDAQKVARGADQLQQWLLTARQWAKKDRIPTGIRLNVNGSVVTDLQYIQQPPTFIVPLNIGSAVPTIRRITSLTGNTPKVQLEPPFSGAILAGDPLGRPATIGDFSGGFGALSGTPPGTTDLRWPVQPLDFLVVKGVAHQVLGITSSTATVTEADTLTLATNINPALVSGSGTPILTSDYYFVRGPRPITGESTLKLPQDVAIDLGTGKSIITQTNGQYDILFSPSGEVLTPISSNKVILWVRNVVKPAGYTDDTLIAIDIRTGLIAAQPVNVSTGDPYAYTKDGHSSGM
jgi:prepilin-type N-terminal cleavage/methylation domain-containing protein